MQVGSGCVYKSSQIITVLAHSEAGVGWVVALELPPRSAPRRAASVWARTHRAVFAGFMTLLSSPGVAKVTLNRCPGFQCRFPRALVGHIQGDNL